MRLREISVFSFRQGAGAGALPPVSAHGFGRGISKAGRIQKQGYRWHSSRTPEGLLDSGPLKIWLWGQIFPLVFASFRPKSCRRPAKIAETGGSAPAPAPCETKTPKFRLKLLTKATFYNFVSLQVYPGYLEPSLVFYFFRAIIKEWSNDLFSVSGRITAAGYQAFLYVNSPWRIITAFQPQFLSQLKPQLRRGGLSIVKNKFT